MITPMNTHTHTHTHTHTQSTTPHTTTRQRVRVKLEILPVTQLKLWCANNRLAGHPHLHHVYRDLAKAGKGGGAPFYFVAPPLFNIVPLAPF